MLRITRELMSRGIDTSSQLGDMLAQINLMKSFTTLQGTPISPELGCKIAELSGVTEPPPDQPKEQRGFMARLLNPEAATNELKWMTPKQMADALELAFEVHGALSAMVKPATPESIEASTPRKGLARLTWPRITDILIAVTFLAVVAFALGTARNRQVTDQGWLQLAFLGAALLGACFSQLYTASKFVVDRTFDPASGNRYMTRVVLGAISGMILANFGTYLIGTDGNLKTLAPSALALVGGYSADAVNSILKRFADTVSAAVRGSGEDIVRAGEAQFAARQAQLEAENRSSNLQARQATLSVLSQIVNANGDTKAQLHALIAAIGKGEDLGQGVLDLTNLNSAAAAAGAKNGKSNGVQTPNVSNATDPPKTTAANGQQAAAKEAMAPAPVSEKTEIPGAVIAAASAKASAADGDAAAAPLNLASVEAPPATSVQSPDSASPVNGKKDPEGSD